jgi:hypothetical protein
MICEKTVVPLKKVVSTILTKFRYVQFCKNGPLVLKQLAKKGVMSKSGEDAIQ